MQTERNLKFYIKLFFIAFKISAFAFGGGYVIISMMQKEFVEKNNWLEPTEMLEFAAIGRATPGAMAVNAAVLTGYRIGGIIGAVVSAVGMILPPLILLSVISVCYDLVIHNEVVKSALAGMQAGVTAIIIDLTIKLLRTILKIPKKSKKIISVIVSVISFTAIAVFKINVGIVIIGCMIIGVAFFGRGKNEGQS